MGAKRIGRWFASRPWRVHHTTKHLWQVGRAAGFPWWERLHGYVYARWPYAYIGAAIGERPERRWLRLLLAPFLGETLFPQRWAAHYHGKVLPKEEAVRLVQINTPINTTLSEQIIPFQTARDIVLENPEHIVALDCPCRLSRKNPCQPVDVCLIVGEPFASFVLAHHAAHARAISPSEAVAIIEAESARGHVHHAFFKEAMLGRFYAICNCCTCCCGAISAHRNGIPMLISSGYIAQVDEAHCQKCGLCAARCPFGALTFEDIPTIDREKCMGCGVCVQVCSQHALALVRDASKPEPLRVSALLPQEMTLFLDKISSGDEP